MDAEPPLVTVVMPVRNEAAFIESALASVLAQGHPAHRLEILVVDGRSDDGTREVVERFASSHADGPRIVVLDNPARTVPAAMNLGLAQAQGSVILRVDGHCELGPGYLATCLDVLAATSVACVGGVLVTRGDGPTGEAVAAAQSSWFGAGGAAFRQGAARAGSVDTLAFGAYRREVFDDIGGFDEELVRNQDDELNLRLTRSGGTIWLDPSIHAVYHARPTLRGIARQYYQYGFFKVRVVQKHRALGSWRQLAPVALVLAIAACAIAALRGHRAPAAALAASYGGAMTFATAGHRPAARPAAVRLPLVYATMHLAYGAGCLAGLAHWTLPSSGRAREWRLSR